MLLARENGGLKIYADSYSLEFAKDRPFVYLEDANGDRIADLCVISSVHPMMGRDDTTGLQPWRVEEGLREIVISADATSSAWTGKVFRFRCQPRRFSYEVEITGEGQISEAVYLGGYYSGQPRWGSGFFWSGQRFKGVFNPEPTVDEVYTFSPEASSDINLTGVPLPGRADWFFTPPPFCFAAETNTGWMSMGIEAQPGRNQYTQYQYHGRRSSFYLSLAFEGYTTASGRCALPALSFDFGPDPYTALAAHVYHLRGSGAAPVPSELLRAEWWTEPIFCGWGAQCYLAAVHGGRAPEYATQASYEAFLHTLALHRIHPGTVVLDDKWQASYGENTVDLQKWPDLPGFIQNLHSQNQHVLLWLKAWDAEGIPAEECITNAAGLPLSVDPTNPAYERRLRASVRRMLADPTEGGYGADGFKIDFSARIPSGPGMRLHGEQWGLELMRQYLWIIHDEAKQVKPDAFIIAHTPHPYLSDLLDCIRLNDINTGHDVCKQMEHRARIAAIACPEALVDMDNWPMKDKAAWQEYLLSDHTLGIPALYYASHIDSTREPLTEEDYALIRSVWEKHRTAAEAHRRVRRPAKISELGGIILPPANGPVKHLTLTHSIPAATKPLKAWDSEILPE